MSAAEQERLAADIAAHGLLEPIALLDGMVLDGRCRLRACATLGVEPRFVEADLGAQRPIEFVLSRNLRRRELTVVQRALLAFDLIPWYREDAAERQRAGRAGLAPEQEPDRGYTNEKVAEVVGIGARTVRRVVAISRADPEVLELMREGAFSSVSAAEKAAGIAPGRVLRASPDLGGADRWVAVFAPVASYLRRWLGKELPIDREQARKRLRELEYLRRGLDELEEQLRERLRGA